VTSRLPGAPPRHGRGGDGTLRCLRLRSFDPTAVSACSSSRFGRLRLGRSTSAGGGSATVSAVPSMTLASSPARAASIPLTYSIAASACPHSRLRIALNIRADPPDQQE
jgi:hypothetical protein